MAAFLPHVDAVLQREGLVRGQACIYDPFASLPPEFFAALRIRSSTAPSLAESVLRALFLALDSCPANSHDYAKAAKMGIEAALCASPSPSPSVRCAAFEDVL
jgi:hypothetical protein